MVAKPAALSTARYPLKFYRMDLFAGVEEVYTARFAHTYTVRGISTCAVTLTGCFVFDVSPHRADHEVGLLAAIKPVSDLLVGPIICSFTDKYDIQQKVREKKVELVEQGCCKYPPCGGKSNLLVDVL